MKRMALLMMPLLLSACGGATEEHWVSLESSGQSEGSAVATHHFVSVTFSHQGLQQSQVNDVLKQRIAAFENWAEQNQLTVVPQRHDMRPVYQYSEGKGRQLVGYKAQQVFSLNSLSNDDYQKTLLELPKYEPEQYRLTKVEASSDAKKALQQKLIDEAYAKAEHTAKAMQSSARLCDLQAVSISVHEGNQAVPPMMMRMESADAGSMHRNQSEEKQNLSLQVSWRAKQCDA